MKKHIVEPYKVFQQHKTILDKLQCDLLRRIYLRNMYQKTADYMQRSIGYEVQTAQFLNWVSELNGEIWMGIKGMRFPLYIECY